MNEREQAHLPTDLVVVGIGYSAGGLEAIKELLGELTPHTAVSIVIIPHLKPDQKSRLREILSKISPLPVKTIEDGMSIEAGTVFVLPPGQDVALLGDVLKLSPRGQSEVYPLGIDFFLSSLSQAKKSKAIGVVLSGTGTDGTAGLKAIKSEGGITLIQDPETARFDGMPRSAIASGIADLILSPQEIARELERFVRHPYTMAALLGTTDSAPLETATSPAELQSNSTFGKILDLLLERTRIDFSQYKSTTIRRRIERQMMLKKVDTLEKYAEYLDKDAEEVKALYEDIFIHVTDFFRDAESYDALRELVFPVLAERHRDGSPIRIWVPGCATGEEAYSLAIALTEYLESQNLNIPFLLFAGDISEPAIQKARKGVFADYQMRNVSPERLQRFFEKVTDGYKVSRALRDLCVFSQHDLTNHPPIPKVDLISCRNVLIYFSADLQKRLFPVFHYALSAGGFLWLGRAETPEPNSKLFKTLDSTHKIFSKLGKNQPAEPRFKAPFMVAAGGAPVSRVSGTGSGTIDAVRSADQVILHRYSPASVVINDTLDILQFRGRTVPYLEPSPGTASYNLLKMVNPELLISVRICIQAAKDKSVQSRKTDVPFEFEGKSRSVTIEVLPLNPAANPPERQYLVVFEDASSVKKSGSLPPRRKSLKKGDADHLEGLNLYVAQLQRELDVAREYQQSLTEEFESTQEELTSTNEELRSTNEELQSTNEELFSTNEELGTAKEELQATNEELLSTNDELQKRNVDLETTMKELEFSERRFRMMIESVKDYAIFMLEVDGTIATWNEGARRFNGYEADEIIGKHFSAFYPEEDKSWKPAMELDVAEKTGRFEEEGWRVRKDGSRFWSNVVISAVRDPRDKLVGFAKVTRDLTERKRVEDERLEEQRRLATLQQIKESERTFDQIFSQSHAFMALIEVPSYRFQKANHRYYELIQKTDIIGKMVQEVVPEAESQGFMQLLKEVARSGQPFIGTEVPITLMEGSTPRQLYLDFVYQPLRGSDGIVYAISAQGHDVTEKVLSRKAVENERKNFRNLFKQTPEMVCILTGPEHLFEFVNEAHVKALGFNATGLTVRQAQPDSVEVHGILDEVYRTGITAELHEIPVTVTGRLRHFNLTYAARRNDAGEVDGIMILGVEITEQVLARESIRTSEKLLKLALSSAKMGAWDIDLTSNDIQFSDESREIFGLEEFDGTLADAITAVIHPQDREKALQEVPEAVAARKDYMSEYRIIRPVDGKVRWIRSEGSVRYAEDGAPAGLSGVVTDITERREIEDALKKSEEGFRTLSEAIPQMIWSSAPDGGILYVNRRWQDYTGISMKESHARGFDPEIHPDDLNLVYQEWERVGSTGEPFSRQYRIRSRDGTYRWFLGQALPHRGPDGQILQWFGTATDIDETKRIQIVQRFLDHASSILVSSQDYKETLQAVSELAIGELADWCGVDILNSQGVLESVAVAHRDPAMVEAARELRRRYPVKMDTPSGPPKVVRTGEPDLYPEIPDELLVQAAVDPEHLALMRKLQLRSMMTVPLANHGKAFGTLSLVLSHGERRYGPEDLAMASELARRAALAIENAKLVTELRNAVQSRDEFLSIASHELKTPLTSMQIQVQMRERHALRENSEAFTYPKLRKMFENDKKQIHRLTRLIDDMLDVTRIVSKRLILRAEESDLSSIVKDTLDRMSPQFAASGVEPEIQIGDGIVGVFDRFRIEQVLVNLLSNALKYGAGKPVKVQLSREGDKALFAVRDQGIGISKTDRAKIFQQFERASNSDVASGLGLGLYICHQIVEAHGGRILVESELHQGSCFTLELPLNWVPS